MLLVRRHTQLLPRTAAPHLHTALLASLLPILQQLSKPKQTTKPSRRRFPTRSHSPQPPPPLLPPSPPHTSRLHHQLRRSRHHRRRLRRFRLRRQPACLLCPTAYHPCALRRLHLRRPDPPPSPPPLQSLYRPRARAVRTPPARVRLTSTRNGIMDRHARRREGDRLGQLVLAARAWVAARAWHMAQRVRWVSTARAAT